MKNVNTNPIIILAFMGILMFGSMIGDSATMDELAHIPAGFGYVTQFDGRLNPEHPPLLKAMSALSAQIAVRPYFSTNTPYWREYVNGQWDQGRAFLYESGNNAERIIFWSRIPFIILTLLFGFLFFRWTEKRFGMLTASIAILFFAFSPTILAHGRYVTTDLGAAFGFFIGIVGFLKFLELPNGKNIIIASFLLAIAELIKFSLILLIPLYAILLIGWSFSRAQLNTRDRIKLFAALAGKTILIGIVALFLIAIAYIPLVLNYPHEKQISDAATILTSHPTRSLANFDLALIKNPYTKSLGQYVLGFLMVTQRAGGGNTGYFLGEVSAAGSRIYFPLLYLLKEPLAFHFLTLAALAIALQNIANGFKNSSGKSFLEKKRAWIRDHFVEFSSLAFIALYWTSSLSSPLNIGMRHVLPTFPFIYILVGKTLSDWMQINVFANPKNFFQTMRTLAVHYIRAVPKYIFVVVLLFWLVVNSMATFPYFLSYYNDLARGTNDGWRIAVDSNYDWGQDLNRLREYLKTHGIKKISLDYFGGGNPRYTLGDAFEPWQSTKGPAHGWFAISATFRQGAFGAPAPGFIRRKEDSYTWLKQYEPVARAGTSIFIYHLP